ncbi:MAG: glycosyltransferase [Alphaproteobacteria bacterium]|nr:glycosyltransferase [Alphaproteobacteria bacterium]
MVTPKISIIIPVYNVVKYLDRCLKSILNQSFDNWEAICMNDGSTDNCGQILEKYARKDKRFKVITQKNQGLSMARNNALKVSCGDYISFLDSDDAMHPQCLEIAYTLAQKHSADLVNFQYEKSDGIKYEPKIININKIKVKTTHNPLYFGCKRSKYRITFNVWSKLYRKELIKDLEFIPNIHFEDYPYTYAVLAKKPKTVVIPTPLIFYTSNESSISNQKANPKQIKDYHTGINFIYDIYKNQNLKKELKFLLKDFFPNILKQQLGRCQRASKEVQSAMFKAFTEELCDLNNKSLIHWRGHKIKRYFKYKKLIKEAAK